MKNPTCNNFLTYSFQLWLCLAESKIKDLDWEKTAKFCFNEKSNPDDDELGSQIVKVRNIRRNTYMYMYRQSLNTVEEDNRS